MKFRILVMLCVLAAAGNAYADNLYEKLNGKTVKVFVAEVTDSTPEREVGPQVLKQAIEKAVTERKSINFILVPTAEEAQLVIDTDIKEFMWTDHDPIDMIVGLAGTAADAAMVEDYARIQAGMTVTDQKSRKKVWEGRMIGTITKKPMSRTESIPLVADNLSRSFIKNCFSKRSDR